MRNVIVQAQQVLRSKSIKGKAHSESRKRSDRPVTAREGIYVKQNGAEVKKGKLLQGFKYSMTINFTLKIYQIWLNYVEEQERYRGEVRCEMTVAQTKVMVVKKVKRRQKRFMGKQSEEFGERLDFVEDEDGQQFHSLI